MFLAPGTRSGIVTRVPGAHPAERQLTDMAKDPSPSRDPLDGMSAEVDRLLKQLPGADPMLRGSGSAPKPGVTRSPLSDPMRASPAPGGPRDPTAQQKLGVWVRVGLGLVVGVLMTQWPYRHGCGLSLYLYMAAVVAVTVAGVWGALSSWKLRMGVAHLLALLVVGWGLVLGATQVLPRVGYAARAATWQCTS